jgi:hypothetical protein
MMEEEEEEEERITDLITKASIGRIRLDGNDGCVTGNKCGVFAAPANRQLPPRTTRTSGTCHP